MVDYTQDWWIRDFKPTPTLHLPNQTIFGKYTEQRIHLQRIFRNVFLPEILGTEPGIRALISFLTTSGAFTVDRHCRDERHTPTYDEEPEVDDKDDDD